MNSNDAAYHTRPLYWLVKSQLHAGTSLADRVQALRRKRRRQKQPAGQVQEVGP